MSDKTTIRVGTRLPALKGILDDGGKLDLKSLRGRWVVIYFYPKDATSGCTNEALDFKRLHGKFSKLDCEIIGVSRDSVASHARFRQEQGLPFHLLADVDESWCKAFDVIHEKVLYGKRHLGVVRSTFLVDPEGVLRAEWRGLKVPGHADAVLEQLASA
jgi:peroxiredoxin Q/BCP